MSQRLPFPSCRCFRAFAFLMVSVWLVSVNGFADGITGGGPTWSETGAGEDMAVAVAAFQASGTPTLVAHAEAGLPWTTSNPGRLAHL